MDVIRSWILSVTVSAILIAAAEALMPAGTVKTVGKLTGGLILTLGIIQPLVSLDYGDLYDLVMAVPVGEVESLEERTWDPMKELIEQQLSAYIADKGRQLGADCTVRVTCDLAEGGVPVPTGVTVTGQLTPAQKTALSRYMDQELGLPREVQLYRTEEAP